MAGHLSGENTPRMDSHSVGSPSHLSLCHTAPFTPRAICSVHTVPTSTVHETGERGRENVLHGWEQGLQKGPSTPQAGLPEEETTP